MAVGIVLCIYAFLVRLGFDLTLVGKYGWGFKNYWKKWPIYWKVGFQSLNIIKPLSLKGVEDDYIAWVIQFRFLIIALLIWLLIVILTGNFTY